MPINPQEASLRLAAAERTQAQLRELIDTLLSQGDAVFASRSWRIGSALTGLLSRCANLFGRTSLAAQSSRHWHDIVDAHYDAVLRQQALLEQLCADPAACPDVDAALVKLWNHVGNERILRDRA